MRIVASDEVIHFSFYRFEDIQSYDMNTLLLLNEFCDNLCEILNNSTLEIEDIKVSYST